MSFVVYSALRRSRSMGDFKEEKLSKKKQSFLNKCSVLVILAQVLLWVNIVVNGVEVKDYLSTLDAISLWVVLLSCVYSTFAYIVLFSSYGWSRVDKLLLFTVAFLSVFSAIYVYNVDKSETFDTSKTENVSAKILAKDAEGKLGSFVLVSGDKVLTYKEVVNFKDFENGDKVKSVSTGKLVVTYKDLFGFTKVRTYKGQRFEKE